MIIPDEYDKASRRDNILAHRNTGQQPLQFIDAGNAAYLPLHYVLYFPFGALGWHYALQLQCGKRLSQQQFYQFHLHTQQLEPSILFNGRRLLQQLVVDEFAVVDQAKLDWIRYNQSKIHADLYNGLADVLIQDECNPQALGKRTVLPSSFLGGDRFMQQLFQDSIAIVQFFGKPTLFITFTANPQWKEIQDELLGDQTATDRPDLIARVFHLKQQDLLQQI